MPKRKHFHHRSPNPFTVKHMQGGIPSVARPTPAGLTEKPSVPRPAPVAVTQKQTMSKKKIGAIVGGTIGGVLAAGMGYGVGKDVIKTNKQNTLNQQAVQEAEDGYQRVMGIVRGGGGMDWKKRIAAVDGEVFHDAISDIDSSIYYDAISEI